MIVYSTLSPDDKITPEMEVQIEAEIEVAKKLPITLAEGQNAKQIADTLDLDKEYCLQMLVELQDVDRLITGWQEDDENDAYSYIWYRI